MVVVCVGGKGRWWCVCWEHGDNMGFISVDDQDLLSPL